MNVRFELPRCALGPAVKPKHGAAIGGQMRTRAPAIASSFDYLVSAHQERFALLSDITAVDSDICSGHERRAR